MLSTRLNALLVMLLSPPARGGWRWSLLALVAVVCFLAFDPDPPRVGTGWDKANHLLAFTVLAGNAVLAFRPLQAPLRDAACATALLALGAAIELLQSLIPGRSGEWLDLLADAAGIAVGLAAMHLAGKVWRSSDAALRASRR